MRKKLTVGAIAVITVVVICGVVIYYFNQDQDSSHDNDLGCRVLMDDGKWKTVSSEAC